MAINANVAESLTNVATIKNRDARKQAFRQLLTGNNAIATIVQYAYHPNVDFGTWDVDSEGLLSIDLGAFDSNGPMYRVIRTLKNLNVKVYPHISEAKRKEILLAMFNNISLADAKLLCNVIFDRTLNHKNINEEFCKEAVPELYGAVAENV